MKFISRGKKKMRCWNCGCGVKTSSNFRNCPKCGNKMEIIENDKKEFKKS